MTTALAGLPATVVAAILAGQVAPGQKTDMYAGGGGSSQGAKMAGVLMDDAWNHDPTAIECHSLNFPHARHHRGDTWHTHPRDVMDLTRVQSLLIVTTACTTVSRARGAAPVSPRVHMLGWCAAKAIKFARPLVVVFENVPEWVEWGSLMQKTDAKGAPVFDKRGRPVKVPDPAKVGVQFKRFCAYIRKLGYELEFKVLDAKDFGNPSTRKRLFGIARRDGQPIAWPEPTHGPGRQFPYRTAAECIDWSNLGSSIFGRARKVRSVKNRGNQARGRRRRKGVRLYQLAPATHRRLCRGILNHVLQRPDPFLLTCNHAGSDDCRAQRVDEPLSTVTTRHTQAVVSPILAPQNTGVYGHPANEPVQTITTKGHQALISPLLAASGYGERPGQAPRIGLPDEPLTTVVAGGVKEALVSAVVAPIVAGAGGSAYAGKPRPVDRALNTVKCESRQALITPVLMNNTTGHAGGVVDAPAPTVTTGGQAALVSPIVSVLRRVNNATGVDEPLPTVSTSGAHHAMVAPVLGTYYSSGGQINAADAPLPVVTCKDRHAVISTKLMKLLADPQALLERARMVGRYLKKYLKDEVTLNADGVVEVDVGNGEKRAIVDILFRMLQPRELLLAMGFPADYILPKVKKHAVRLIGNAVAPPMMKALLQAVFPGLRREGRVAA